MKLKMKKKIIRKIKLEIVVIIVLIAKKIREIQYRAYKME